MNDDGGVVRSTHVLTRADQRDYLNGCTRCVLRDCAWWLAAGGVVGVLVALLTGGTAADVVLPLVLVAVFLGAQVTGVRSSLARSLPVGAEVETVVSHERVQTALGAFAPPQATGVRQEGPLVRIDLGPDHTHVLPRHVDVEAVRRWVGVPTPGPADVPGTTVVVPSSLARSVALRVLVREALVGRNVLPGWALAVLLLLIGQWSGLATVVVCQLGALAVHATSQQRAFERAFPSGVPLHAQWDGQVLEVRSTAGLSVVPLGAATSGRGSGDLFVVRRPSAPPLLLPAALVDDDLRDRLSGRI